jgi:hypothetical protein
MKRLLTAAASALVLASADAASQPAYDIRLDSKDGQTAVSVVNNRTGAFAVAAGGEQLDLLAGDDAKAAFERLKTQPDIDMHKEHSDGEHGKRKIIVHKMDYEEDDAGDEEKREVRVIKRHKNKADKADDVEIETTIDIEDDLDIELTDDSSEKNERRIILINAADGKAAAKFIDGVKGLDNDEKAAMKAAVGL